MNLGLVQNGMLMGLFALAIPFIIHLMFRQKPRDVQIGSVRFLREIMEKHKNRRRVMRWLLMSLRMLGIALLALLFARPFMTTRSDGEGNGKFLAVLIDRSASMQLRTEGSRLVDTAIEETKGLIRKADGKTKIEIAFFDHEVTPVTARGKTGSIADVIQQLTNPPDSFSATDYAAAFRWAHDVCTNAKTPRKELHIYTDLQQSGLAWSEIEPMPTDVLVTVHDLGRDLPNNVAITGATPARLVVRPGETTKVEVSLLNAGPFPLEETPVAFEISNGKRTIRDRQKVKLESDSIQTVQFELPDLDAGIWKGSVTVEAIDDMPFDNTRHLAIMSAPQYRVLIKDGEPYESDFLTETHFVQSALRLAPEGAAYAHSPYFPETRLNEQPLANFDVVLMANVAKVPDAEAQRLRDYVDQGGGLLVFAGEQVSKAGYAAMASAGLIPGEVVAARESFDLPWRIQQWDQSHSIFAAFNDPQHGDLRKLSFRGITELIPNDTANVIAQFHDGKPFVLEQQVGEQGGHVIWVTAACDNQWSNWTQSELYLPIMHQLLGHLTGLNAGGPVREQLIDTKTEAPLLSHSPGVFAKNKAWQVVNVSPRESETDRCTVADFVNRFGLNVGTEEQPVAISRAAFGSPLDVKQDEIWHWILFALVTVIVAEFFVSNRTVA